MTQRVYIMSIAAMYMLFKKKTKQKTLGINSGAAPLYLMEIAPTSLRGFAGVFNQLAINIGILVSQILGLDSVMGTKDLWPYDLGKYKQYLFFYLY